ncbi:MAG: hypothetical protein KatS3mg131_0131 [Candidatus Tectimicrobiota bacterium]|nr:MAG: hypothetical protein KatS3mg131_0131 [Candidatus Tectomicrobia bacterium]
MTTWDHLLYNPGQEDWFVALERAADIAAFISSWAFATVERGKEVDEAALAGLGRLATMLERTLRYVMEHERRRLVPGRAGVLGSEA